MPYPRGKTVIFGNSNINVVIEERINKKERLVLLKYGIFQELQ